MQVFVTHLPVLQILLPLLSAPLCLVLPRAGQSWLLALAAALGSFCVSILLLLQVLHHGEISYFMGGWAAPWGIEYKIDTVNAYLLLIVSFIACMTLVFAAKSARRETPKGRQNLFYTAFLLCFAGLLGIAITGDAFNLFVFLEISSLSSYILISMGQDRRALSSAFQYLVMGTIGATLILLGIGFLYMMTGTLNMADLADRLPELADTRSVRAAFAFIIVGISIKLALFPLHGWLPGAYGYAPAVVSAFLAATSTKIAAYVLMRFIFTIFGVDFSFGEMNIGGILTIFAVIAVFAGSLTAIFQTNIKHMLAYSSVAQIGYIVIGIAMASSAGLTAGILHLFNHALIKCGLFLVLGCLVYRFGAARIQEFRGLGKTMPWTAAAFVICALSLIGVPLTAGFISKWYLVLAALEQGGMTGATITAAVLIGSLLAVAYCWRLVEVAYFEEPPPETPRREAPLSLLLPLWLLVFANVYFGIKTDLNLGVAAEAARQLLGGHL